MDNQRLILFAALSIVVLLLWQAWEADYAPKTSVSTSETSPALPPQSSLPSVPSDVLPAPAATPPATVAAPAPSVAPGVTPEQTLHVVTDVLDMDIALQGGTLLRADLLKYPVRPDQPEQPYRLLDNSATNVFIAQSGLLSAQEAPDHYAKFNSVQPEYRLAPNSNELKVMLTWTGASGVTVNKIYTFKRGSYLIEVDHHVVNLTKADWHGRVYRQWQRSRQERESAFIYTYTGGVIYSDDKKYEKLSFDDMDEEALSRDIKGGWAAMIQHYFLGAWLPEATVLHRYYSKSLDKQNYILGMVTPEVVVPAGRDISLNSRLYVGPKLQEVLEDITPGLELTVDYGVLTFIAKPLFWLLEYIYKLVQNWGWAIILLTLVIKLVFYKLSESSYKSMANMRKLMPKITSIRERYSDDRQRMSQAMMDLYKQEKINPLGGCLPILVQIPVFIALYWVLLESVELRQAPFILWINDLSTKDPYYVLPLIMGATMYVQQKLNPPPPDPVQAKVMMVLPFVFTLFFAFFPAGLVLYWVANNLLSIAQQWYITRKIEKAVS